MTPDQEIKDQKLKASSSVGRSSSTSVHPPNDDDDGDDNDNFDIATLDVP